MQFTTAPEVYIHGGGRRLGVGGNKWSWGEGQRRETLVPLNVFSIPGSRDGKDGGCEGKKEKKLKTTEPALPSQCTLQKIISFNKDLGHVSCNHVHTSPPMYYENTTFLVMWPTAQPAT